jgi:Luciferase-like monooxygenase
MAMACLGLLTPGRRWRAWPAIPPRSDLHPGDIGNFPAPRLLAMQVAQVDEMSGGRVERGLGTGWSEREHAAYGIPFPESVGERSDRLEEQLDIVTGLWETPLANGSPLRVGTTPCSTRLRCPSRCRPGADGDRGERAGVTPQSSAYAIRPTTTPRSCRSRSRPGCSITSVWWRARAGVTAPPSPGSVRLVPADVGCLWGIRTEVGVPAIVLAGLPARGSAGRPGVGVCNRCGNRHHRA